MLFGVLAGKLLEMLLVRSCPQVDEPMALAALAHESPAYHTCIRTEIHQTPTFLVTGALYTQAILLAGSCPTAHVMHVNYVVPEFSGIL